MHQYMIEGDYVHITAPSVQFNHSCLTITYTLDKSPNTPLLMALYRVNANQPKRLIYNFIIGDDAGQGLHEARTTLSPGKYQLQFQIAFSVKVLPNSLMIIKSIRLLNMTCKENSKWQFYFTLDN